MIIFVLLITFSQNNSKFLIFLKIFNNLLNNNELLINELDDEQSIKNYLEEKIDNINEENNKIEKDDESLLGENFKDFSSNISENDNYKDELGNILNNLFNEN